MTTSKTTTVAGGGQPDEQPAPVLRFDHNVIEHLGIKLYQNKPANVLAELVANSWDAGARNVWIDVTPGDELGATRLSVSDDGVGMTLDEIRTRYLVIGKSKRASPAEKTFNGRGPMGRKGIGKLAPFGIATVVDVATIKSKRLNWFSLDLVSMQKAGEKREYRPTFAATEASAGSVPVNERIAAAEVAKLISRVKKAKSGTAIVMSKLTVNELPNRNTIATELSRRFTVILARPDFIVHIDGEPITAEETIPAFDLRLPKEGVGVDTVDGKEVRFWAGFFSDSIPPVDQAGVGVFTHGKIAQDRPFFFYVTGKEVFHRYLYAVIEADWLDELERDLVSTDRTSIDWSDPAAASLKKWGRDKVSAWLNAYARHRAEKHRGETKREGKRLREAQKIPRFSKGEDEMVERLVADATKDLPKSQLDKTRTELFIAVTSAWTNEPSRRLVKNVWDDLKETATTADQLGVFVRRLDEHSVPEAMNLALTFAQRAYALTMLDELIHRRSETNLQDLIESFPWILEPRGDLLTANRTLKTTIEVATDVLSGGPARSGRVIQGMTEDERADFVFLTDASEKTIRIIELKAPGSVTLNQEHARQLLDYLDFTSSFHPKAATTGLLVGNPGSGESRFISTESRITVKSWDEVVLECRAAYVELLAAMLSSDGIGAEDGRIALVRSFAGDRVWKLLHKLAGKDTRLAEVIDRHAKLRQAAPKAVAPKRTTTKRKKTT